MDSVFKFWFGNYSVIFAEKLKNCFFQRGPGRDSPYGFSFSVFQFGTGTIPERTEKLKNCFFRGHSGGDDHMVTIWIQFFSFSVSLHYRAGATA